MIHEKLESIQYNAGLSIIGVIGGSSKEKIYQELGFESLQQSTENFVSFSKSLQYLSELTPTARQAYVASHQNSIPFLFLMLNLTILKILSSLQL